MSLLTLSSLILSLTTPSAPAASLRLETGLAARAYLAGETSRRTLVVKPISLESFLRDYGAWGEFSEMPGVPRAGFFALRSSPDPNSALGLLERLEQDPNLEYAYFNPVPKNAVWNEPAPVAEAQPKAETPNFESRQYYLENSPRGVGARAAWAVAGGTGENVKIVDVEVCWQTDHEDFAPVHYLGANPQCQSNDHGTAVWGEIAAKKDGKGVTGIAYGARFGVHGFIEGEWDVVNDQYIASINHAIQGAMAHLAPGDVLVIEQHMYGPDQDRYVAVEYWPHIYEQLKAATDRGILCVEAAGNGGSNFDSPVYKGAFDLKARDSGCILVGAGDPKTRERLSFSNYGSRIDAFGFGRAVTTTGYGDAFNGGKTRLYTSSFSGTSSATPIVAGAVAVASSIAKASGRLIAPREMRELLRRTGVPQGPKTSRQRIGNLPNIPELVKSLRVPVRRRPARNSRLPAYF